jgi:hypothetical protein
MFGFTLHGLFISSCITRSIPCSEFYDVVILTTHHCGAVVEALRYKPEGRGFISRWCRWIFSLT